MQHGDKQLLVVGDRVLIEPEGGEVRTKVGLILPATAAQKEDVHGGRVVAVGPGTPLPPIDDGESEPWKEGVTSRYMPMQVADGDYALFFRRAAFEIRFDDRKFLVVPQSAILVVVRGGEDNSDALPDALPEDL